MMADGRLNKCKECTKGDSKKTYEKIQSIPELAIRERKRQRIKENKRRIEGRAKKYKKQLRRSPASDILARAIRLKQIEKKPCEICGKTRAQGHHEDYSKPLDVVWLCIRHHNDRHIHLRDSKTLNKSPLNINDFINTLKANAI